MIVALADNITLTDLQLRAYEQMLEPKKLATVEGGHFDLYLNNFPAPVPRPCRGSANTWPLTVLNRADPNPGRCGRTA